MTNPAEDAAQPDVQPGKNQRAVVVGPVILDHYHVGNIRGLDQTAPVPVTMIQREFVGAGGAANAADSLAYLAMPTAFVSVVGEDDASRVYLDKPAAGRGVTRYVAVEAAYTTPIKHRVYANHRLVARYDHERPPTSDMSQPMLMRLRQCFDEVTPLVILISDYNKGVCTPAVLEFIMTFAREHEIPVVVDPTPSHMEYYAGAYAVTPNALELMAAAPASSALTTMKAVAAWVRAKYNITHLFVTLGSGGIIRASSDGTTTDCPAVPAHELDTCGAGDTVAAAVAYGVAADMPPEVVMRFANIAGALAVEQIGAQPVSLHAIHCASSRAHLPAKQVDPVSIPLLRRSLIVAGQTFGIANGVFDVLHPGHISMLRQARAQCDFLCVLLNTDKSATRIKRTPLQPYSIRAAALAAQPAVDAVLPFDGDTPVPEIRQLRPDLLVKGPEYADKIVQGREAVEGWGGKVLITTLEHDTSTSAVLYDQPHNVDVEEATPSPASGDSSTGAAVPDDGAGV